MVSLKRDDNDVPVLGGVTDDANQTISPIKIDPATGRVLVSVIGGTSINVETPTGTVNGVNTTFTVSNAPTFVIIDGMVRFSGFGYTYSLGTITVDPLIPPTSFIRSIY